MSENARFIKGLRRMGWTDTEINNFALYLEDGDETFFENKKKEEQEKENQ
ncbi:MAG: hypothetical protein IJV16_08975 [Lachnospiraceae bacterium]|nr:hypothetical protein [Lachnospiraceae bacterium]